MSSHTYFEIDQLRAKNRARVMESVLAFIVGLFSTALLPSLLAQYLYSTEQLMQGTPALLTYIRVASFLIPVAYLLFTIIGNFRREKLAQELESQLVFGCDCEDCCMESDEMVSEDELRELETIVEEALKEKSNKKSGAKKETKKSKSPKKSSKKSK